MNERDALRLLATELPQVGDDCAVVDDLVLTTDMLHAATDFPDGVDSYTIGWRSVGVSLSDIAAMGAEPIATLAAYAPQEFDAEELRSFVSGAGAVSDLVGTEYVGGDLDRHDELTVSTTAVGRTADPVLRAGASPGEVVCVTGEWGRTAAGLQLYAAGEPERANELFRFEPRIEAGLALADVATAMMDSSDGLARSLHQLAEASECGIRIDAAALPVSPVLAAQTRTEADQWEAATYVGEDFELVCTVPESAFSEAKQQCPVQLTQIGRVIGADEGVLVDGVPGAEFDPGEPVALEDRGYIH